MAMTYGNGSAPLEGESPREPRSRICETRHLEGETPSSRPRYIGANEASGPEARIG